MKTGTPELSPEEYQKALEECEEYQDKEDLSKSKQLRYSNLLDKIAEYEDYHFITCD